MTFCLSIKKRDKAFTLHICRCGYASEIQNRRKKIDKFDQRASGLAAINAARKAKEQGTADRFFVSAMLFKAAMLSQQVAIVAQKNHYGILRLSGSFQRRQHSPDILIQEFHGRVISRDDTLLLLFGERAKDFRNLPIIFRTWLRHMERLGSMPATVFHRKM